jgi:hypothetical protein
MKLDSSALSSLNDKELEQLRSDIELTNKYIKEGLLKFDDEQYTYYGFAYVENNPVKTKMVEKQLIINIQVQCVTLGLLTIAL